MKLGNKLNKVSLLSIVLFFYGCTIINYKSPDISEDLYSYDQSNCEIVYFIQIEGFHKDREQKELSRYTDSIDNTLASLGCNSVKLKEPTKNSLLVNVKYEGFGGASGQEFLTGLSLGLIPSWTTRKSIYVYNISNGKKSRTYNLDQESYNHLILLPLIWLNFLTDDESDYLGYALENFIKKA